MYWWSMLQVRIVSVNGELFNGEVEKLSLPTDNGMITILEGHTNLVTQLAAGTLQYKIPSTSDSELEAMNEDISTIDVKWWVAMIEADVVTVAAE